MNEGFSAFISRRRLLQLAGAQAALVAATHGGTAFAALHVIRGGHRRDASWLGALVVSHWVLDLVVHRPDLPLYPGGARVGFGLWNSVAGTLVVELAIFGLGVWLYLRTTRAQDRVGAWALWSLVSFLLLIHAANLLGPPPPSVAAIAWVGQAQWLLVLWGYWIDHHREPS